MRGSRAQELEQARAAVDNAAAIRAWTARDYQRTQELFDRGLVAAQEVDRMRQAAEVAAANDRAARERLALLEAGAREHEIEAARQAARAARERLQLLKAGPRPEAVAAVEAQMTEAMAAVALARARLDETRLTSPIVGVVQNMEPGETASPGRLDPDTGRHHRRLAAGVRLRDRRRAPAHRPARLDHRRRVPGAALRGCRERDRVRGRVHAQERADEEGAGEPGFPHQDRRPDSGGVLKPMAGTLGIGILVSAASRTVPQAMQLAFLTFLPSIYLSGPLFPIEGMPRAAQYLAAVIPLTYYLRVVRGIVLKGVRLEYLWPNLLPLALFGAAVFTLAVLRFRKQLD